MANSYGTLYLIPCTLGNTAAEIVLPQHVIEVSRRLSHFVVEQPKSARQFLAALKPNKPIQSLNFSSLNEHTNPDELADLLAPLLTGEDVGVISEAGCPGIADPGADLVRLAHRRNIRVIPLVGPSAILLALMASGLNGQCFAFHGYLPIADDERGMAIKSLEAQSAIHHQTQIFIETPYRNDKLFAALLTHCHAQTMMCVATELTTENEQIWTKTMKAWKSLPAPLLNKRPSIFMLLANR
ncbi:MAG: SAM-dependent methyltransferase [Gallionella sp.]